MAASASKRRGQPRRVANEGHARLGDTWILITLTACCVRRNVKPFFRRICVGMVAQLQQGNTSGKGWWDLPRVIKAGVSAAAAIILTLPGPKTAVFAC